ncbi:hypothetical protein [Rhizobium terrae]|uniref:hypothetical protein n=1 Tax=Rhizobium terrae TaxID=2171756 RepID=UPI0013C34CA0|nr:hypothetical protein [Rhizobium terrae]
MLRKYALPGGVRSFEDALGLFALNEACPEPNPEWTAYFVETMTAFIVHGAAPAGLIDEAKAGWLIRSISIDGVVHSALELELLLHVMEVAAEVPESLSAFALDQIRLALEPHAIGAYHAARPAAPGVTAYDLAHVWRVLRGALDRGRLMLSPLEARVLKEIDECAPRSEHHPAWRDMMSAVVTFDRPKEVLRTDRWLVTDDRQVLDEEVAA